VNGQDLNWFQSNPEEVNKQNQEIKKVMNKINTEIRNNHKNNILCLMKNINHWYVIHADVERKLIYQ